MAYESLSTLSQMRIENTLDKSFDEYIKQHGKEILQYKREVY